MDLKGLISAASVRKLSSIGLDNPADLWEVCARGELAEIIPPSDAERIRIALTLGREVLTSRRPPVRFSKPEDLAEYMLPKMVNLKQEHLYAVYLRGNGELIEVRLIGIGTSEQCAGHPRDIFRGAIETCADMVVILHNHPDCNSTPSQPDVALTARLGMAGEVIGVRLLDHIIIGREGWTALSRWTPPPEQVEAIAREQMKMMEQAAEQQAKQQKKGGC